MARFLEYAGATGLFGAALFYLTLLPPAGAASAIALRWPKPLLLGSGLFLLIGALLSLAAQAAMMNGIALSKLDIPSVTLVLTDTQWGHAIAVRIVLAILTLGGTLVLKPSGGLWWMVCVLGVILLASFAWTGHGASTEGTGGLLHLLADISHLIAAGVWLGALAAFLALLRLPKSDDSEMHLALFNALKNFSGIGSALVAVLVVSGLINSYFLIAIDHLGSVFQSPYSVLLLIKLAVFTAMLGLAAKNRFVLTPALDKALRDGESTARALARLRQSIVVETVAGATVIGLVSVLGMMEPLTAQ